MPYSHSLFGASQLEARREVGDHYGYEAGFARMKQEAFAPDLEQRADVPPRPRMRAVVRHKGLLRMVGGEIRLACIMCAAPAAACRISGESPRRQ